MREVRVEPLSTDRFESVLGPEGWEQLQQAAERSRRRLGGRTVWHVNSTEHGGGVAEMLWSLIAYARGVGVDTRWTVMEADEPFFRVTKRIHNMMHGSPGDGHGLTDEDRAEYERIAGANAQWLIHATAPGDVVILHDPQTAGLVPLLPDDRLVVWRSHIGIDAINDVAHAAWGFLRPYIVPARRCIVTRRQYAPEWLDAARIVVIPPSIDAFSPKNQDLDAGTVSAILQAAGIVSPDGASADPAFVRVDGRRARVERRAE